MSANDKKTLAAKVYLEDTVRAKDSERLGLVMRTWHDFQSEPDEYSDDEDPAISGVVPHKQATVSWLPGKAPRFVPEDDLIIVDRSLMYGDVVKRSHHDLQSGNVINVEVRVDLKHIATGKILTGIDTKKLKYCWDFQEGGHVMMDNWLGIIEKATDEVTVCFVDGSICIPRDSEELSAPEEYDVNSLFFPDRLSVGLLVSSAPENYINGKWLHGKFDPQKHDKAIVIQMRTSKVAVRWVACNQLVPEALAVTLLPPQNEITNLDLLKPFHSFAEHATFDIGDTVFFKDKADTKAYGVDTKLADPNNNFEPFNTWGLTITNVRTTVDVEWQDLTVEHNVPAIELLPYMNVDDQDVWPCDYVLDKAEEDVPEEEKENRKPERLGIVQSVKANERTCKVRWLKEDRSALEEEEELRSFYEVAAEPDLLSLRLGDKVVLTKWTSSSSTTRSANDASTSTLLSFPTQQLPLPIMPGPFVTTQSGKDLVEELKRRSEGQNAATILDTLRHIHIQQLNNDLNLQRPTTGIAPYSDMNWFGEITRIARDKPVVEVGFISGERVEVPVGQIMVVDIDDETADLSYDDEDEWGTDYEDEGDEEEDTKSVESLGTLSDEEGKEGDDLEMQDVADENVRDGRKDRARKDEAKSTDDDEHERDDVRVKETEQAEMAVPQPSSVPDNEKWTRFSFLEEAPADHHFIRSQVTSASVAYYKRISKEYKILEASLPDNILVRAFEDRMDIFRVLIVGPSGTPYEDTLFLFDFQFPSAFPQEPPIAYFHSWTNGIGRVNPNLYEDGKVCLSLLNTWHGKDETETWNPTSTIFQLLISIQGLILVKEPFYNEAGFEKFVGDEEAAKQSTLYTEKAFLLCLRFVDTILLHPPSTFATEVEYFYHVRGILWKVVQRGDKIIQMTDESESTEFGGSREEGDGRWVIEKVSRGGLVVMRRLLARLKRQLRSVIRGDEVL